MTFLPAWQAAAPSDGRFGIIDDGFSTSAPYWESAGLVAWFGLAIVIPFLAGRFWGRHSDMPRRARAAKTLIFTLALGIPCYLVFHLALRGKYLGNPVSVVVILVHLAGVAFILGRLKGRHDAGLVDPDDFIPL